MGNIDAHRISQESVAATHLHAAGSAVADHDTPRALIHLSEYVRLNPGHADTLLTAPALLPIQGGVQEMLRHVTRDARIDAESMIATARLVVSGVIEHPPALYGPDVLTIAERLAESGQLLNYIRASELSQSVMTAYFPVRAPVRDSSLRRELVSLIAALWDRVPLLVLLGGWFVLGAVAGAASMMIRAAGLHVLSPSTIQTGFELWGIGFLALAGLQFCLSVRGMPTSRPE